MKCIMERQIIESDFQQPRYTWSTPVVTWKIESDSIHIEGTKLEQKAITRAFLRWQLKINLKFKRVKIEEYGTIRINFVETSHKEFKDRPNAIAIGYFPHPTNALGGDIYFNEGYLFRINETGLNRIILESTAIHEIGHAIGVDHIPDCPDCIMYPVNNNERFLKKPDWEAAQFLYGTRSGWSRLAQMLKGYLQRSVI